MGKVQSVTFSPDSSRLASASLDGTIKLWEVPSGDCVATLVGHNEWVVSVAFSLNGNSLASASYDRMVKL